jgi:polyisoprenoid-binding protein YceI
MLRGGAIRRLLLGLGCAALWLAGATAARAALYHIDQRYGTIEFTVTNLGMFTTKGRFARFHGDLEVDPDHPERTHIDVTIDGNSVEMPLQDEVDMLRSPAYFNTVQFPTQRFVSSSIESLSPSHYLIHGTLQIRGVVSPQDLDAVMTERHVDEARHVQYADFIVTGKMRRSVFGMVADPQMVSDIVTLTIRIRLTVEGTAKPA